MADLLMLHQRDRTYRLDARDSVLIDADAPVTCFSPVTLRGYPVEQELAVIDALALVFAG